MRQFELIPSVRDIRLEFARIPPDEQGMREIVGCQFLADEPAIFGTPNEDWHARGAPVVRVHEQGHKGHPSARSQALERRGLRGRAHQLELRMVHLERGQRVPVRILHRRHQERPLQPGRP